MPARLVARSPECFSNSLRDLALPGSLGFFPSFSAAALSKASESIEDRGAEALAANKLSRADDIFVRTAAPEIQETYCAASCTSLNDLAWTPVAIQSPCDLTCENGKEIEDSLRHTDLREDLDGVEPPDQGLPSVQLKAGWSAKEMRRQQLLRGKNVESGSGGLGLLHSPSILRIPGSFGLPTPNSPIGAMLEPDWLKGPGSLSHGRGDLPCLQLTMGYHGHASRHTWVSSGWACSIRLSLNTWRCVLRGE